MAPQSLRDRLGRIRAWALRMALAVRDDEPDVLRALADQIQLYELDPDRSSPWPADPLWIAIVTLDLYIDILMRAAEHRDVLVDHVPLDQIIRGVCGLLPRFAPDAVVADAIAAVEAIKDTKDNRATLGNLYATAAIAGWVLLHPWISPNPEGGRYLLVKTILETEAVINGVPEVEAVLDVTDAEAIGRLQALLQPSLEVIAASGLSLGEQLAAVRATLGKTLINPNPERRTRLELALVFATKAHLLEHPERTSLTDGILLNSIGRCLSDDALRRYRATQNVVNPRSRSSSQARIRNKGGHRNNKRK
jgi:hypothetical protein